MYILYIYIPLLEVSPYKRPEHRRDTSPASLPRLPPPGYRYPYPSPGDFRDGYPRWSRSRHYPLQAFDAYRSRSGDVRHAEIGALQPCVRGGLAPIRNKPLFPGVPFPLLLIIVSRHPAGSGRYLRYLRRDYLRWSRWHRYIRRCDNCRRHINTGYQSGINAWYLDAAYPGVWSNSRRLVGYWCHTGYRIGSGQHSRHSRNIGPWQ